MSKKSKFWTNKRNEKFWQDSPHDVSNTLRYCSIDSRVGEHIRAVLKCACYTYTTKLCRLLSSVSFKLCVANGNEETTWVLEKRRKEENIKIIGKIRFYTSRSTFLIVTSPTCNNSTCSVSKNPLHIQLIVLSWIYFEVWQFLQQLFASIQVTKK